MTDIIEMFNSLTKRLFPDEFMKDAKVRMMDMLKGSKPHFPIPEPAIILLKMEDERVTELIEKAILESPHKTHEALKISNIDTLAALWYRIDFARDAVGRRFHNLVIEKCHPEVSDVESAMIYVVSLYHAMSLRPDQLDYIAGRYY